MTVANDGLPVLVGRVAAPVPSLREELDAMLSAPLALPRLSPFYVATLVLTLAVGLALPVVYLLLPTALGAGALWWFVKVIPGTHNVRTVVGAAAVGVGLLVAAFSMLAPLFTRWKRGVDHAVTVTPVQEPLLHGWVQRCAALLRTRVPDAIELIPEPNAAVVFDRGRIILRLGTPLVAVLSVTELTGVLAHELGHVRQGWPRRAFLLLRGVGGWFEDVVRAEMDRADAGHDDSLVESVRGWAVLLAMMVLRGLMHVAEALALWMAREMELDADRYEAALVGPTVFASTLEKLVTASVVVASTTEDAENAGAPFPDNMARYAAHHVARVPPVERRRLTRLLTRDADGVPHPPYTVRVENARATPWTAGRPAVDRPAVDLFRTFDGWATRVTPNGLSGRSNVKVVRTAELVERQMAGPGA